jgi:hypothetical protein
MQIDKHCHIVCTVEGVVYPSIKALANAYNLTYNGTYKRWQRGKRGDDLVPEKKRKNYVPPKIIHKYYINEKGFKSRAEALRHHNVPSITFRSRKARGLTDEQAMGIEPFEDKRFGNTKTGTKKRKEPLALCVFGKTYKSLGELAKAYNLKYFVLQQRINKYGYSPEEAVTMKGRNSPTIHEGKIKYRCEALNIVPRKKKEKVKKAEPKFVGGYNKTILERDKKLANKEGILYFVEGKINDKYIFKIGITTRTIEERLKSTFNCFKIIGTYNSTLLDCFYLEQEILKKYNSYQNKDTLITIDGYTEMLKLPNDDIINSIINYIKRYSNYNQGKVA